MGGRGKKRAFLKCKWSCKQQRFLSTGCLSGTALTQCRSHTSGTVMKMYLLPGLGEIPALPTEQKDEQGDLQEPKQHRERERSTPSLDEALCLQFKEWLKMSSAGHGLWHSVCPGTGLGISVYKNILPRKGRDTGEFQPLKGQEGRRKRKKIISLSQTI